MYWTVRMGIAILALLLLFAVPGAANTIINFEAPLPPGLAPVSFWEDTPVSPQARITNQYGSLGILMSNVALVALGSGHAPSGINGIGGISSTGTVDYGSPVTFTFVDRLDNTLPSVVDHFAVSTDRWGGSLNTTTVSGYDLNGNLVGSVSHLETGGSVALVLQGVGDFHTVVVSSTLSYHLAGGIGLDDLQFGPEPIAVPTSVPEPRSYVSIGAGLICVGLAAQRRRRWQARSAKPAQPGFASNPDSRSPATLVRRRIEYCFGAG